jgi:hypothetical protein
MSTITKTLTPAQERYLRRLLANGTQVFNDRARRPLEALEALGFVSVVWDQRAQSKGGGIELVGSNHATPTVEGYDFIVDLDAHRAMVASAEAHGVLMDRDADELEQPATNGVREWEVTIHGPNLADQSKGDFRVHLADCRDNARVKYLFVGVPDMWTIKVHNRCQVIEAIYPDQLAEGASFDSCYSTVYFEPCLADLPVGEESPAAE